MTTQRIITIVLAGFMFTACRPNTGIQEYTDFINKDTANIMISSYLNSIMRDTASDQAPALNSLIIDADELRTYLNDNKEIINLKLMFAHTLQYIKDGNAGKYAGYRSDALTLIIAGYNSSGNYVYATGNRVPDHCAPCPHFCRVTGTAANNLLE